MTPGFARPIAPPAMTYWAGSHGVVVDGSANAGVAASNVVAIRQTRMVGTRSNGQTIAVAALINNLRRGSGECPPPHRTPVSVIATHMRRSCDPAIFGSCAGMIVRAV